MKKIFLCAILCAIFTARANICAIESWKEHWQKAEEAFEKDSTKEAYQELTGAISIMTMEERKENAFIYLLLAEANIGLENYEEALKNIAIAESGKLNLNDKQKVSMLKIIAYMYLGKEEERRKEMDHFREIFTFPTIDHTDKSTIIRDVPDSECARKIISAYLLGSNLCASESDIFFSKNNTCFAKRTQDCGCGCGGKGNIQKAAVGTCDYWCDRFDVTSQGWCFNHLSDPRCKLACILTVEAMSATCHFCCAGGGFYLNCVQPFATLAEKIGEGCNPDMD